MYRIVLGTRRILGMADPVNRIYGRMVDKSYRLMEHIGKCVIWGKSYHSYDHWVHDEISVYINEFARKKPKSRLKEKLIKENLFGMVGTEIIDALNDLRDIYDESQMEPDPYPGIEITYDKGRRFFQAYRELADEISFYLANHMIKGEPLQDYRNEIDPIVHRVLDKYCY